MSKIQDLTNKKFWVILNTCYQLLNEYDTRKKLQNKNCNIDIRNVSSLKKYFLDLKNKYTNYIKLKINYLFEKTRSST